MRMSMMKQFLGNSYLFGANAPFIEALYESYLAEPGFGRPRWRGYFDELQRAATPARRTSRTRRSSSRFAHLAKQRAGPPGARRRRPAQLGAQAVRRRCS